MFKKLTTVILLLFLFSGVVLSSYFNDIALGGSNLSCEQDSDGDGIPDCMDPCPFDPFNRCIAWIEWEWESEFLKDGFINSEIGQTISLNLMLEDAPTGLQEYKVHFQIGDSRGEGHIAKIKEVKFDTIEEGFCRSKVSTDPNWQGFWIKFTCADKDNVITGRDRKLKMATVKLEAIDTGETYLWFRIKAVDDNNRQVMNKILPRRFAFKLQVLK